MTQVHRTSLTRWDLERLIPLGVDAESDEAKQLIADHLLSIGFKADTENHFGLAGTIEQDVYCFTDTMTFTQYIEESADNAMAN
jgi:hypothetical protein